jgi:hypothetical protein
MSDRYFSDKILTFLRSLTISASLPRGVNVLNPYQDDLTFHLCEQFYTKYYKDHKMRSMIIGINPGRLGGGLTGIPFTDPKHLEESCGIKNPMQKKTELSSSFIYEVITAFGGPKKFYQQFYFSSVSPLGFVKDGKNLNYYDDSRLQKKLESFILASMKAQLNFGIDRSVAYCLGEGENSKFLKALNEEHQFFNHIIPLAHPRFIMQYKSKSKQAYIQRYLEAFLFTPGTDAS